MEGANYPRGKSQAGWLPDQDRKTQMQGSIASGRVMLRVRRHAQNRYKAEQKKDSEKKTYMNITCNRLAYTHNGAVHSCKLILLSTVMTNKSPAICE